MSATSLPRSRSVLSRYSPIPCRLKLFFWLRFALTPYSRMAKAVPSQGRVLDLGCGHGFLSLILATDPDRRALSILGLDHDPERIALARAAARDLPQLEFRVGDETQLASGEQFDAILAIDFFHYFSREEQVLLMRSLVARLRPDGVLVFREINPDGGLAASINRTYEWIATRIGFTRSKRQTDLSLRAPDEWQALSEDLGLVTHAEPCSHFLFSDVLFVGRKAQRP